MAKADLWSGGLGEAALMPCWFSTLSIQDSTQQVLQVLQESKNSTSPLPRQLANRMV